jgi:hypothetical protein
MKLVFAIEQLHCLQKPLRSPHDHTTIVRNPLDLDSMRPKTRATHCFIL